MEIIGRYKRISIWTYMSVVLKIDLYSDIGNICNNIQNPFFKFTFYYLKFIQTWLQKIHIKCYITKLVLSNRTLEYKIWKWNLGIHFRFSSKQIHKKTLKDIKCRIDKWKTDIDRMFCKWWVSERKTWVWRLEPNNGLWTWNQKKWKNKNIHETLCKWPY